jgi:hypothetical protein
VVEPAVRSTDSCYAEWVIEEIAPDANVMIGVTDLGAPAPVQGLPDYTHNLPGSRMYACLVKYWSNTGLTSV